MINCRGSNSDECHCMCHGADGRTIIAKHIVACCYECSKCGRKIPTYSWDSHKKACGQEEAQ